MSDKLNLDNQEGVSLGIYEPITVDVVSPVFIICVFIYLSIFLLIYLHTGQ